MSIKQSPPPFQADVPYGLLGLKAVSRGTIEYGHFKMINCFQVLLAISTCERYSEEGLTVFRDQEFSADMMSRSVKRIGDVRYLRDAQFAEDASPMVLGCTFKPRNPC